MHQSDQITAREAAFILGCHVATVNRMAKMGKLPIARKLPGLRGHNLFDRSTIEYIARQQREEARSA